MTSATPTGQRAKPSGRRPTFWAMTGLIAPSATGRGVVLTVFESRIDPGKLTVNDSHTLTAADLPATE